MSDERLEERWPETRLEELRFWAESTCPTEAISDEHLKELLRWAADEIASLRAALSSR